MTPIEMERILDSMTILRDTREQNTARARRRYKAFGLPCKKAVLDYGDYTYNANSLPTRPSSTIKVTGSIRCVQSSEK